MLPKSVSPRFVPLAAAILAASIPLAYVPINLIHHSETASFQLRFWLIYFLLLFFVVPKALSYLGIRIRTRSVERFQAVEHDGGSEEAVELPIRIVRGQRLIRVPSVAFYLGGLVCLVLAWFPLLAELKDPWVMTLVMLGFAVILMGLGFLAGRAKPDLLCEVSDEGIRAPDGFWGRLTFVPWGELTRCEIIHDDERVWHDYFRLWDRTGRRRFKRSKRWVGLLRRGERERIFRVLRARFPRKAKPDQGPEPAMAGVASAAVWDRELDG
jgi:hypothetical protein